MNQFPDTFDGRFYFTNFSEEDFTARWNNVAYTFPAQKTSPMIIPSESLENIQAIRKKFARELAEREYYKSEKFRSLNGQIKVGEGTGLHSAVTYTESDLTPYVDRCLEPLPVETMKVSQEPRREVELSVDEKGKTPTRIIDETESLVGQGQVVA